VKHLGLLKCRYAIIRIERELSRCGKALLDRNDASCSCESRADTLRPRSEEVPEQG
jgi:hypothetical protein